MLAQNARAGEALTILGVRLSLAKQFAEMDGGMLSA
jgi:hypothetical protein